MGGREAGRSAPQFLKSVTALKVFTFCDYKTMLETDILNVQQIQK